MSHFVPSKNNLETTKVNKSSAGELRNRAIDSQHPKNIPPRSHMPTFNKILSLDELRVDILVGEGVDVIMVKLYAKAATMQHVLCFNTFKVGHIFGHHVNPAWFGHHGGTLT